MGELNTFPVSYKVQGQRIVIVGGGDESPRLRALATELGIDRQVRFLGWRSDLPRIYADSDVVALTSDNEGTPVSLIEALAAWCAVASTDVGGVRDVLDGGRLGALTPAGERTPLEDECHDVVLRF